MQKMACCRARYPTRRRLTTSNRNERVFREKLFRKRPEPILRSSRPDTPPEDMDWTCTCKDLRHIFWKRRAKTIACCILLRAWRMGTRSERNFLPSCIDKAKIRRPRELLPLRLHIICLTFLLSQIEYSIELFTEKWQSDICSNFYVIFF
jgi:hypothetical protein